MDIRLSSFKRGHGLKELLSSETEEFWHTDDNLPHYIQISFNKRTYVETVQLLLLYSKDDSYTPEKVEVRTGTTTETMSLCTTMTFIEPEGFVNIDISSDCFILQIIFICNHQEGRDSHVRQLKVFTHGNKEILI
ncbi:subunit 10 of anaphase-promoting complex [Hamiltosporidium magnivora]|uniref:Subunit 10 of anaphase-promoting complex n=1 Tax=Hamiltosporidium magnivora TaxID=148818 RepID=A0A4Q9LIR5_9MICR|nr:subunit 10 of anaphase-promoting complex [Hamiltosporidium magnivora]TBU07887.1 subunit 10 of anaphase-promoting complex [Hamiltosporidium magnivora]